MKVREQLIFEWRLIFMIQAKSTFLNYILKNE